MKGYLGAHDGGHLLSAADLPSPSASPARASADRLDATTRPGDEQHHDGEHDGGEYDEDYDDDFETDDDDFGTDNDSEHELEPSTKAERGHGDERTHDDDLVQTLESMPLAASLHELQEELQHLRLQNDEQAIIQDEVFRSA